MEQNETPKQNPYPRVKIPKPPKPHAPSGPEAPPTPSWKGKKTWAQQEPVFNLQDIESLYFKLDGALADVFDEFSPEMTKKNLEIEKPEEEDEQDPKYRIRIMARARRNSKKGGGRA